MEKGQKFCDKCGTSVEAVTTPAEAEAPVAVADVAKVCTNCGANIEDGQKFCEKCGAKLGEAVEEVKAEVVE
ncbi:MAG: zinc ribbon domain-containing protein [Ruminococcus sp.]|nr:zinc ribbon domain-containing protein [Ruminococcus sp.]